VRGRRVLKFYVDVHRGMRSVEGFRITYSTDGKAFKHVDSFSGIPAGPGDQLFVDTIPPSHTDGAIELLGRGVRSIILGGLHCLRRCAVSISCRRALGGDIKELMDIEEGVVLGVLLRTFLVMR
jgi:hypothetical protein